MNIDGDLMDLTWRCTLCGDEEPGELGEAEGEEKPCPNDCDGTCTLEAS